MPSDRAKVLEDLGVFCLVASAYWIAARLSLGIALVHGQVTPIWPPTGIAVVALLLLGRRAAVAVAVASFLVNLPIGPSPLAAAGVALGDTLAPLASAELLRRAGFHLELDRLRDAFMIIGLGALAGMLISATAGTEVLLLAGAIRPDQYLSTWAIWWAGDAMGVLLVAPFLLSLRSRPDLPRLTWRRGVELILLLLGAGTADWLIFQAPFGLEYLVFPLIMLAAWRFRLRGAAPAALITSAVAIWTAVHGTGPFAGLTLLEKMVALQTFNVSVALASFVLAAFVEAREHDEQAMRLYESARLTSKAKSEFLNLAAHELRTPLTVLAGYLSLLAEGALGAAPARWSRPMEILVAKTAELNQIVESLLRTSRLESGTISRRESADLRDIVLRAVDRAQARADLLGATVRAARMPDPIPVNVDSDEIGRILDNLVNNGLAYSRSPAEVTVHSYMDQDRALVQVADNGVGIPEPLFERVFECFFRGDEHALPPVPGSGLGLYLSRRLAESHGGSLRVLSSELGAGSTFALALPLERPSPGPVSAR